MGCTRCENSCIYWGVRIFIVLAFFFVWFSLILFGAFDTNAYEFNPFKLAFALTLIPILILFCNDYLHYMKRKRVEAGMFDLEGT